jgi:hypothetical protein
MDLPHRSPEPTPRETGNPAYELERLHNLFVWAMGALLVFTLAANLFIGWQMRLARLQLPGQRDGVIRQAMEFQKRDEPIVRKFVARLQEFARTNRDFQPVLDQYRMALGVYFASQAPSNPPAKK